MRGKSIVWGWALAAAIFFSANAPAAVVVSDFDPGGTYYGGTEGWFPYGTEGMTTVSNPTGGSTVWGDVNANQYAAKITAQDWAVPGITTTDWNNNSRLQFQIILPGSGPNVWLPNGNATVEVEFQTHTGGAGTVNKYAYGTVNGALKDTVQQLDIDYSGLLPFAATPNWNLSINLYPGYDWGWDPANGSSIPYDAHWLIDNIQLSTEPIPEPASLGVLALSALALGRRRR